MVSVLDDRPRSRQEEIIPELSEKYESSGIAANLSPDRMDKHHYQTSLVNIPIQSAMFEESMNAAPPRASSPSKKKTEVIYRAIDDNLEVMNPTNKAELFQRKKSP